LHDPETNIESAKIHYESEIRELLSVYISMKQVDLSIFFYICRSTMLSKWIAHQEFVNEYSPGSQ